MLTFAEFLSESKYSDQPWYHGTTVSKFDKSRNDHIYLTDDKPEAEGYARGGHLGGTKGDWNPHVKELRIRNHEKTMDINHHINRAMEDDGDLEGAIHRGMAEAKKKGMRYVTYHHPSNYRNDRQQNVRVSMYPHEDLKVKSVHPMDGLPPIKKKNKKK